MLLNLNLMPAAQAQNNGWRPGYVAPNNVPCPPGYNQQTYNSGGSTWRLGPSWGNYQGQRPSTTQSWCAPYQQPRPQPMPQPYYQPQPRPYTMPSYRGPSCYPGYNR